MRLKRIFPLVLSIWFGIGFLVSAEEVEDISSLLKGRDLASMDDAAINLLILELKNPFSPFHNDVMDMLVKIGGVAVEPLINAVKDESEIDVKLKVVEVLGKIGDSCAVEPLVGFLIHRDEFLRCCAAVALGNIGDARAVDPLTKLLEREDGGVRLAILESLEKIKSRQAMRPKDE